MRWAVVAIALLACGGDEPFRIAPGTFQLEWDGAHDVTPPAYTSTDRVVIDPNRDVWLLFWDSDGDPLNDYFPTFGAKATDDCLVFSLGVWAKDGDDEDGEVTSDPFEICEDGSPAMTTHVRSPRNSYELTVHR